MEKNAGTGRIGLFSLSAALPGGNRLLYRGGFLVVLLVLAGTLLIFFLHGSLYREWINPFSVTGAAAFDPLNPANLAVALIGTVGLPPFVVVVSLLVMLCGWFFILFGLRHAGLRVALPFLVLLIVQHWLLVGMLPDGHRFITLFFGAGHLLCFLLARFVRIAWAKAAAGAGHFFLLCVFGVLLFRMVPARMDMMLGLSAAQLLSVAMLVLYWFMLGYDALEGSIAGGRFLGRVGRERLPVPVYWPLVFGLVLAAALWLIGTGGLLLPFGIALVAGEVLSFVATRGRDDRVRMSGNLLVFAALLFIVLMQGVAIFLPDLELFSFDFLVPPVVLYTLSSMWGFVSSGPLFVEQRRGQRVFPRESRLFVHIGWVMLSGNCLLFFIAARDDSFMKLSDRIGGEALLAIGIPVLLYLLFHKKEKVFESVSRNTQAGRIRRYLPRIAFAAFSLVILAVIQLGQGLSVYSFSRMTYTMARGNILLRQGAYTRAMNAYGTAAVLQPRNGKPQAMFGVAAAAAGDRKQAIHALEQAVKLAPETVDSWLLLGSFYRQEGRYAQSLAAYSNAIVLDPSDSFIYRNMGICQSWLGKHAVAEASLRKALAIMPGKNEFGTTHHATLGMVLLRAGRYKEAEAAFHRALVLNPRDHLAHSDLGVLAARGKRWQEAVRHFTRAQQLQPENTEILEQLLVALTHTGDMRAAAGALERAVRARPDDKPLVVRWLGALLQAGLTDRAGREIAARRRAFLRDPAFLLQSALLGIEREEYPAAKRDLDRALALRPGFREALLQRAYLFRLERKYAQAYADYRSVLARDPGEVSALAFGGVIAVRDMARYKEGYRMLRRVFAGRDAGLKPAVRITGLRYLILASVRIQPPDAAMAIAASRKLLRLLPEDPEALSNLSILYGATRRYMEQAAVLEQLVRVSSGRPDYRLQLALAREKGNSRAPAIAAYRELVLFLEKIPDAEYAKKYGPFMKGFTREQVLQFCRSRITALE